MLLFALLWLYAGFAPGNAEQRVHVETPDTRSLESHAAQGQATLNEMFREVEELMEDTQQKLQEAVHQMENETSKSLYGHSLPSRYDSLNRTEAKEARAHAGGSPISKTLIQTGQWNNVDHECLTDEDCEEDNYCRYELSRSKCAPCRTTGTECEKNEECCGEQLCVWGLCALNRTTGQSGTICQQQSDCSSQHCCAFHRAFLFPVCRPRPREGQGCHEQPNQLLELLLWDDEAPYEHCPCAAGLQCQLAGKESLCTAEKS
ncbi:dickkopf-related protein 3b [Electrophorus electricus]|uniref:Dickkopf WNT signaling pathway inhibitor 3b n=1 Tax=Electrophorus electricus TaxID=8005 RepID=A0A4W4FWX8_ELEEL|nr:dickkopf-related protein 3b [Electrophorus electricus]